MTVIRLGARGTTVEAEAMGSCLWAAGLPGEQERCPSGALCSKHEV